jgi:hypothetical protein
VKKITEIIHTEVHINNVANTSEFAVCNLAN